MELIKLIEPNREYAEDIWKFRQEVIEIDACNNNQFAGCMGLKPSETPEEWIQSCILRKEGKQYAEDGRAVPSDMYIAIRQSDNRIIGIIDLRHHIDHPILGTWGGHCGYTVRPSERGKGYAKEMLRLNIENAKRMSLSKLLITCDTDNHASEKAILDNHGVFDKVIDVDGIQIKRYWIFIN